MKSDVSSLRNEYLKSALSDADISSDPFDQFKVWFDEAIDSDQMEPNAMILGTVENGTQPHQRTVLLKGYDTNGFVFYTNYKSNKGLHLERNPHVNLLFPWYYLQRQIIICGEVEKVSKQESEAYFHSRPRGSQLSAFISNQSEVVESRDELEKRLKEAEEQFKNQDVPLPENWGGYLVTPTSFEFWQGRENRLHDRYLYQLEAGNWSISRLSP